MEVRVYESDGLQEHQLVLLPLYAHTQHGACGLHVTVNGKEMFG